MLVNSGEKMEMFLNRSIASEIHLQTFFFLIFILIFTLFGYLFEIILLSRDKQRYNKDDKISDYSGLL